MNFYFYGIEKSEECFAINKEYKGIEHLSDLYEALLNVWCLYTCTPRLREHWSEENKTLGQCSITAFLVQDIFGGEVYGIPRQDGSFHCFNVIDDCIFDLTSEQFGDEDLDYSNSVEQFREEHFANENKRKRYDYLCLCLREYLNNNSDDYYDDEDEENKKPNRSYTLILLSSFLLFILFF